MTSPKRRAVFTGLGVLTPIGTDPASFHQALLSGTPGVRRISHFDPSALPCAIAGVIDGFDFKKFIPADMKLARKAFKTMGRTIQLGVCAAQQTMAQSGPKKGEIDPFRFGIEFGCVMVATELEDLVKGAQLSCEGTPPHVNLAKWGTDGLKNVPPLWMLKYLPNMPACHVSINYDAQGPNNTITSTETAGLLALGEAYRLLGRNAADYFLVGGCDSKVNPLSMSRYNSFYSLTRSHNDTPATAVRPFDAARDGTALGEAAAVFGLEDLAFAQKRGTKIDAELVGFASGFDKGKTGPTLAGVIRNALREAGISPADVDHVNAGAGGWPDLDAWEARAIREVFGDAVPVVSYKGHIGNTGAAAGLVELAVSVMALKTGELPGTINCDSIAADCLVNVQTSPRKVTKPYAVKVTYTNLGQCAVAVVRSFPSPPGERGQG
jgi:3-oxoacyl-[acyl-carrier-protein] synthase II